MKLQAAAAEDVQAELQVGQPVAQVAADREHDGLLVTGTVVSITSVGTTGVATTGVATTGVATTVVATTGPGHASPRRTVTATSATSGPTGACGLWTVTSAACTGLVARHSAASRSASVSIRSTGSP